MDNNAITTVLDYLTKIKTHIDSKWQSAEGMCISGCRCRTAGL